MMITTVTITQLKQVLQKYKFFNILTNKEYVRENTNPEDEYRIDKRYDGIQCIYYIYCIYYIKQYY